MKQKSFSNSPFEQSIGFCRALRVDDRIIVSGTAPIDPDGRPAHPGDLYKQTRHCLSIIVKAIEDLGGKQSDVVRTRMFLVDIKDWESAGRAHGDFFADVQPAATMVGTSGLIHADWLIEIEAEAIVQSM